MWEKVAKRSHKPVQIYAFGPGSDDVMLHGTVDYVLKDDKKASSSWGARAHFAKEDGELKMNFYQVFLVSAMSSFLTEPFLLTVTRIPVPWQGQNNAHECRISPLLHMYALISALCTLTHLPLSPCAFCSTALQHGQVIIFAREHVFTQFLAQSPIFTFSVVARPRYKEE